VRELLVCSMCVALVCCSMLQCVSGHLHVARELLVSGMCIAVCCSVGQCVTSLCSVLQCSALQDTCVLRVNCSSTVFVWCSVFWYVAECCRVLQYVARHSRVARELVLCGMCVCRVLRSSAHVISLNHTMTPAHGGAMTDYTVFLYFFEWWGIPFASVEICLKFGALLGKRAWNLRGFRQNLLKFW